MSARDWMELHPTSTAGWLERYVLTLFEPGPFGRAAYTLERRLKRDADSCVEIVQIVERGKLRRPRHARYVSAKTKPIRLPPDPPNPPPPSTEERGG